MVGVGRRIKGLVSAAGLFALVLGCTGAPDRHEEAARLESALRQMPGVDRASVAYENAFARGATLGIDVAMPTATETQIGDVVSTLGRLKGHDFDGFYQWTNITVTQRNRLLVRPGTNPDVAALTTQVGQLRAVEAAFPGEKIEQYAGIDITELTMPVPEALARVRTAVGSAPIEVVVKPKRASDEPIWSVQFPFSAGHETAIRQRLGRMPITVGGVWVGEAGYLTRLTADIRHRQTAYDDLAAAIVASGAGKERPMNLLWAAQDGPQERDRPTFHGEVSVGSCDYGSNDTGQPDPKYYTPDAIDVQKRIRERFDNCPR
ncbi:hypothetical protein ABG82_15960 [Mycobacteroides immunogenum]|uniref:Uncharacterized protein n=2 Tax=Mycobacteroides immunogenum TaxID=83262 RepID=A0A7V8LS71_9MYCO|nr:hypothetical protein ABG82_15960 [Mycobacteroides immunogenum]ANO04694.1 hypothetical protein BAB75_16200 [Mycobacteroides immunogenum]KIU39957.1 hypothetical protein TL11_13555 [Mycobacteroides immunogenum]KPG15179.1 hypothetical protein AN909_02210 [Mycobacteroides immunogenum]KPG15794.1 hypothetical protein AN910_07360 [Mycobacteroides immunogenum]